MKCKHCKREIHVGCAGWSDWQGNFACTSIRHEPEQTETQRDLQLIRARQGWLAENSQNSDSTQAAAALYRTVIRLAERVGLE
jgi:hypothetical protein